MSTPSRADRILYLALATLVLSFVSGTVLMANGGFHTDLRELGFGIEAGAILLFHVWVLISSVRITVLRSTPFALGFVTVAVFSSLLFIDIDQWNRAYR